MIRLSDIIISFIGLIFLSPLILIIIFFIKLTSKGSIFYKQLRVGKNNKDFFVWKFRTMYTNADKFSQITVGDRDPRITQTGYFLRKYKFDELPQLYNVLIGQMSIVGPRPEVRKYVDLYSKSQAKILEIKPGITDWASIIYRNENEILGKSHNPEDNYVKTVLPDKINYNLIFLSNYTLKQYYTIIFFTIIKIISPSFLVDVSKFKN